MRRETRTPREDWKAKVERLGLTFHTLDGEPYWNENAAYRFTSDEITELERVTNQLHEMCLAAVEQTIERRELGRLGIPERAHRVIAKAWEDDPPAIYGRFDLAYDGSAPPKLLEYNADTPTSLLEAAVIQWHWLQDVAPESDQFNSIWEGLVAKWHALKDEGLLPSGHVHFGCMDSAEDLMTTAVLMDTAQEAGLRTSLMPMSEIGWDHVDCRFVDGRRRPIETFFKLYPWEWMLADEFGTKALRTYGDVQWIEPIWKMVLSNKAILAILWEMYPEHPNLLRAYLDGPRDLEEYVRKPLLGREGANVAIHRQGQTHERSGPYGEGAFVYQAFAPLPVFDGNHAVLGSWIIDGEARGIGVRESDGPITEDTARFVPHLFDERPSPASGPPVI
jgi:glutathionylspermidine synthase